MTTQDRKPRKIDLDSHAISWRYGSIAKDDIRKVKKWLGSQRNKNEAITQVILHMIERYGYKDVLEFDMQRQLFADSLQKDEVYTAALLKAIQQMDSDTPEVIKSDTLTEKPVESTETPIGVVADEANKVNPTQNNDTSSTDGGLPAVELTEDSTDAESSVKGNPPQEVEGEQTHPVATYDLPNADVADMLNHVNRTKVDLSPNKS